MDEQQNIIIYRTADGKASVALYARDGKIWEKLSYSYFPYSLKSNSLTTAFHP